MRQAIDVGWGAACKPPRAARCWGTYIAPDLPWRCKWSPRWPVGCRRVQTTPIIHNFQPLFEHLKSVIRFPVQCHKNREPQINRSRELTPSVWGVFTLWLGKFREGVAFVVGLVSSPQHPPTFSPQELQWSKDHGASRNRLSSPPVPGEILLKELTCFLRCLEDIP